MIDIFLFIIILICTITDIRSRKIYNKVIFPSLFITFFYYTLFGGWDAILHSFIGLLIGLGLLIIPYFLGGMGAGDVKFLALVGAMKGGVFVFHTFLYTAIFGAVIAIGVIVFRNGMLKSIFYYLANLRQGIRLRGGVSRGSLSATYPYGVAIAAGTALCLIAQTQGWSLL